MKSVEYVLSVDVGTTNIKAGLINENGEIINLCRQELIVERNSNGKAEHDPFALFNAFTEICRQASNGYRDYIKALTISSYQFCMLPVDSSMKPLTGIMTLLDTRAQDTYPEFLRLIDVRKLYDLTGCPPLFQYPISKIFWMKKKLPDLFGKVRYFLGSKDYLIYRIMGFPATDASLASSTSILNIKSLDWDSYTLDLLDLRSDQMPSVMPSEQSIGKIPSAMADRLGLSDDTNLIMGVYDGGAVGIGLGCLDGDTGIINLGTTAMLRTAIKLPFVDNDPLMRLQTCYLAFGKWFPGGGINNAGILLKWLRDNILDMNYNSMMEIANSVKDTKGLFCLPFLSGERNPQIGNHASGMFFGLRAYHTKAHIIRSVIEGVSFMLKSIKDALADNGVTPACVRVGGGGSRSDFWLKMIASVLKTPVQSSSVSEPALIGSAMIAFTALKSFDNIEETAKQMCEYGSVIYPAEDEFEMYNNNYSFFKYLVDNIGDLYLEHSKRGF